METNVEPATDGVFRRIFPSLATITMGEIVSGFPVVVGLIAILDWGEECSNQISGQEDIECLDRFNGICAWTSTIKKLSVSRKDACGRLHTCLIDNLFTQAWRLTFSSHGVQ